MNEKFDIATLGEILIDFTESGSSKAGMRLFEQNPGGAVANVLCTAAKLGKKLLLSGKSATTCMAYFYVILLKMPVLTQAEWL